MIEQVCPLTVESGEDLADAVNQTASKKTNQTVKTFEPLAAPLPQEVVPGDALRRLGVLSAPLGLEPEAFQVTTEWAAVRYFWALDGNPLALTGPAKGLRAHHRGVSSEHLGIAFGLEVAYRHFKALDPTTTVRFVDGDVAIGLKSIATLAGPKTVAQIAKNTPDYFAVVTKGLNARFWAVEVKGTHRHGHHLKQLADAARQVTGVAVDGHIPESLAFATVLLAPPGEGVKVFALDPPGRSDWVAVRRERAERRLPEWDPAGGRVEVTDASDFAARLVDAEGTQLVAYATGEAPTDPSAAPETHARMEFENRNFLGREVSFTDGRVRVSMFRGVEEERWRTLTSPDFEERAEAATHSEARFTRETVRRTQRVTSLGEDGTILDLQVRAP